MKKQRIEWVDIGKGILIILVIFGHLNAAKWFPKLDGIIKWIYTFHMMAFFILSGIVFNIKCGFKEFIVTKLKTLMVPFNRKRVTIKSKYFDLCSRWIFLWNDIEIIFQTQKS